MILVRFYADRMIFFLPLKPVRDLTDPEAHELVSMDDILPSIETSS